MKTSEGYRLMRAKIEAGWTQRSLAVDANGVACSGRDPRAVAWCLAGASCAIMKQYAGEYRHIDRLIMNPWCRWNDAEGRTKEEVLAMLDQAIAMAEAEEGLTPPESVATIEEQKEDQ